MTKKEEWRDIPDWEGYYQVSSRGRVYSVPRVVEEPKGLRRIRGRLLRLRKASNGSWNVRLSRGNKDFDLTVGFLVAITFLGIPSPGLFAFHKDRVDDDRLENIEWRKEIEVREKARNKRTILTNDQAREIRIRAAAGESTARIAADFPQVSLGHVRNIACKRNPRAIVMGAE